MASRQGTRMGYQLSRVQYVYLYLLELLQSTVVLSSNHMRRNK